ncbi:cobalamin biosynthesis protein CobQ [Tateyamaria omphalii]|uniref:cobalamin biosynthesis protein CobQ n=1 Tax=Tateyamaria omphalii TaxID=299262 RepID=UPI001C998775|nr:cobalamin biosynthesis protein CobQ [Tateyamaria omphalii]MBY5931967.1 cobalamin biosynthesis protein CobQ [Tateyamaria omphalii]
MNTPAHLLLGAAVFGKPAHQRILAAAFIGALLPDLSLYVMAGVSLYVLGIPPRIVFDDLYFSNAWQTVFAIDNSFVVWGLLCAVAAWCKSPSAIALTGAALLHLLLDFPLHHDDGRPHFWPLSRWVFESPVSYWDRNHGAAWIAPIEAALATVAAITLWRRALPVWSIGLVALLLLAELWVVRQWLFFFVDS